jgi:glycosyltransferase involved in cell wall biosynthesis
MIGGCGSLWTVFPPHIGGSGAHRKLLTVHETLAARARLKFAYFGVPRFGGVYTVYRSLRKGLANHGVEVRWLDASPSQCQKAVDQEIWSHESANGEFISDKGLSESHLARMLVQHIERHYDGVFVTVMGSRLQTNAIRYLNSSIRRLMIVHTPSLGTLAAARAVGAYAHATVAVSLRTNYELVAYYGFSPDTTKVIGNAIDLDRYLAVARLCTAQRRLRLLSFGRIEEAAKGVFWLPAVLARLLDLDVCLTVAGDGPDRAELERRCKCLGNRVQFIGRVPERDVPCLYADHDVFLMPSRMEGFGQTIIEAMAAGCVPIVSRIRGVTDTIVRDGDDGRLFPVGDAAAAANAIRILAQDPDRLAAMSRAARANVLGRFDLETQAKAYAEVIEQIMTEPPRLATPLPLDRWYYPRGLRPGVRTYLPNGVKNRLRVWRERLA